jgi:hypothetical protein
MSDRYAKCFGLNEDGDKKPYSVACKACFLDLTGNCCLFSDDAGECDCNMVFETVGSFLGMIVTGSICTVDGLVCLPSFKLWQCIGYQVLKKKPSVQPTSVVSTQPKFTGVTKLGPNTTYI